MKLYHTSGSPPSRSVLMTLRCLELEVEIVQVDLFKGEHKTPEFLKLNPIGQIPVLVDGDVVVTESRAIMTYLANSRKSDRFYPSDARQRAIVDSRLYFDATGFFVHILATLGPIFFRGAKEVTPDVREKLTGALRHLEGFLQGRSFFAGEQPTLADISILSNVVQVRNAFGGSFGNLPSVNAWFERCASLPGYEENLAGGRLIAEQLDRMSIKLAPLD